MNTAFAALLGNSDDTVLVDKTVHRPGSDHATAARRPARIAVGHAHALHVQWCRTCYPHGAPH